MNAYPDNLTAREFLELQGITLTKHTPSFRAQLVARRTYQRPIDEAAGIYETWAQVAERVRSHQQWLWERAAKRPLTAEEHRELLIFRALVEERACLPAGRMLWLGGTEVARTRAASMINCSFSEAYTIHDIVDIYWLLLQGAGTGFSPRRGALSGFLRQHKVEIIRSTRTKGDGVIGRPDNHESFRNGVWRISVGDSAEAWAKMIGKILAGKRNAHTLVIDFREVRAAGERLGNYGWISSGDAQIAASVEKLCALMNARADTLLSAIDILDVVNLLGETLSSRRSAQIALLPSDDPEADEFAMAKKDCWANGKAHRGQSNNSITLDRKPTKAELRGFFATMEDAGGSEPGFVNVQAALKRAPWFAGVNPCFDGNTLIATKTGAYPIRDLVGRQCDVWDGNQWVTIDNFRVTGTHQPMLRIEMYDGTVLRVTPGHKMVLASGEKIEAGLLEVGDALKRCPEIAGGAASVDVTSITDDGIDAEVFCCTVPTTNNVLTASGILTGQCAEQLLANGGVCNLTETVMPRFTGMTSLRAALTIIARANYRATCIDLNDGVLQRRWHEINEHLHLCGVGLTGIDQWLNTVGVDPAEALRLLRGDARRAADAMANSLGLAKAKHVTTVKPAGTTSKISDCTEGVHQAIGYRVVNTIMLSSHDPLVGLLTEAGYPVRPHPSLHESVLVQIPVEMPGASNRPLSAIEQLERYKLMMENWVDSNCSITVYYEKHELRAISNWLFENWDVFVGVSFLPRVDATKTAEELGYAYLPQAIVSDEEWAKLVAGIKPVNLDADRSNELVGDDCASGVCPVR